MTKKYPFIIGGEQRTSDNLVDVRFPYNDELVAQVYHASEADMEEAIQKAVKGFEITRKLPSHQRAKILTNLLDQIIKREEELVQSLILEGGKTTNVAHGEFLRAQETIRISAMEAQRIGGEIIPLDLTEAGEDRMGIIRRFPLGPVLGIAPFNYPLNLACHKLGPAVAAGNSIIIKPASVTPSTAIILGEMLLEAGFPPEAISVVPCSGSKAEKLVTDPRIAFLTFTGSSQVGWHLKSIAGRKRVCMELGGNAAAIVHEDANIPYAVSRIANGGMANAGQNCISVQRVFLHRPIYEETLPLLVEKVSSFKVGDPRDPSVIVGPMISRSAAVEAFGKVQEALQQGAKALIGGTLEGSLMAPTLLVDTTADMRVNNTEMFAPVMTISVYDTWEEVIARTNDSDYGLQSGIFTQNMNRILQAYEEIKVGGLQVNDVSTTRFDQMPYGGVKDSGIGREGPKYAIEEMTEMKLMVINKAGGLV